MNGTESHGNQDYDINTKSLMTSWNSRERKRGEKLLGWRHRDMSRRLPQNEHVLRDQLRSGFYDIYIIIFIVYLDRLHVLVSLRRCPHSS